MNSQHKNTNAKGDFILKTSFKHLFKDFYYIEINVTQVWYENLIFKHLKFKFPTHSTPTTYLP